MSLKVVRLFILTLFWTAVAFYAGPVQAATTNEIRIVELQGTVEVSPVGATTWVLTQTNQVLYPNDRLRTATNSRVALRWSDQSVVQFGASTELEILPPHAAEAQAGLRLVKGMFSFLHRDAPNRIRILTRGAVAGVEGTEFVVAVDNNDRTTLSVIDGQVRFSNDQGALTLTNGQQGFTDVGQAPQRTAGFIANNLLQWSFYYPAVVALSDLTLTSDEQNALGESLAAYRAGDLLAALAKYPAGRTAGSDPERVYYAALLLSVGEVEGSEAVLQTLTATEATSQPQRLAASLRLLVAAVKRQADRALPAPQLASEYLASSYYEQSHAVRDTSLKGALEFAWLAVTNAPDSGFGWARVAELEFSFGHTRLAAAALEESLKLSPRNAQALALKGFLLAANNDTREAIAWFNRAIAVDAALGNAWLGRGLCRIRRGDAAGGREDLLVAAALEPQRAAFRSYLGKANANEGDFKRATQELELAKKLDPNDPSAYLYSALLKNEDNQINDAIRDLEKSKELNDNRSVYRSGLLLDQDSAVRSANLARLYQDAGMNDVAVREAARAVNADYANYSGHLFLANSYDAAKDPSFSNPRYEPLIFSEYLVASLLAPANAGPLSSAVSQGEYSRLFDRNRLGVVSSTEYLSRGAWTQSGAQYGNFGDFNYSVGAVYRHDPGQRANNDLEERFLEFAVKQQLTLEDSLYVRVATLDLETGDVAPRFAAGNTTVRSDEMQEPTVDVGYHHQWSAGNHTLVYLTRVMDKTWFHNDFSNPLIVGKDGIDEASFVTSAFTEDGFIKQNFTAKTELYTGELQQIFSHESHTTILGVRATHGQMRIHNDQYAALTFNALFPPEPTPPAVQYQSTGFDRFTVYGYHQWQLLDSLKLIGGITYDWEEFPENYLYAPISDKKENRDQISPKAGFIWTPLKDTTARFAYTRSLGGVTLEQGYRIEPSQVAGFAQSYRSLIPDSVAGPSSAAEFETYDFSLEHKFSTGTYLGVAGQYLNSHVDRTLGAFDMLYDLEVFVIPSTTRQELKYNEQSITLTANQLVGRDWSLGTQYRVSQASLFENFVDIPDGLFLTKPLRRRRESLLHQVNLIANYNHPSGFFSRGEAQWFGQHNGGFTTEKPGDDFWQLNLLVGYRFYHRKAEVAVGLLNVTDQDYHLSSLNLYNETARERTLLVRFLVNF